MSHHSYVGYSDFLKLQTDFFPNFKKVDAFSAYLLNLMSLLLETVHILLIVHCWVIVFTSIELSIRYYYSSLPILAKIFKTIFSPNICNFYFYLN